MKGPITWSRDGFVSACRGERQCKWRHVGHASGNTNTCMGRLNRPCMGESMFFLIGPLIGQMGNGLEVGFNGGWIIGLKMTR